MILNTVVKILYTLITKHPELLQIYVPRIIFRLLLNSITPDQPKELQELRLQFISNLDHTKNTIELLNTNSTYQYCQQLLTLCDTFTLNRVGAHIYLQICNIIKESHIVHNNYNKLKDTVLRQFIKNCIGFFLLPILSNIIQLSSINSLYTEYISISQNVQQKIKLSKLNHIFKNSVQLSMPINKIKHFDNHTFDRSGLPLSLERDSLDL